MRFPSLSRGVHVALLFACHFFLGAIVAVWATYQYEQSHWLAALSREQGRQLLSLRETLLVSQTLRPTTTRAVQRELSQLRTLRREALPEAQPILDLRLATAHATLARLYQNADDPVAALAEREAARSTLRGIGWKSISEATLDEMAARRQASAGVKQPR